MPAELIHLVRHGEVHNPNGVLYGRLPEYHLSGLGHAMARVAAERLHTAGAPVHRVISSPLIRTIESAAPWAELFNLSASVDDRLIEPSNMFEGHQMGRRLREPASWPLLLNPLRPSWGEPYAHVARRMLAAISDAWSGVESGDVVLVTHQLPIWMVHRTLLGKSLPHDPRQRRCALSSITTLSRAADRFVEVNYQEPAAGLAAGAIDRGAA